MQTRQIALALLAAGVVSGCATPLTAQGAAVRIVNNAESRPDCQFLGMVTGKSAPFAVTPAAEAEYALNDVRNQVVNLGGNAMRMISNQQGLFTGAVSSAEAYRCEQL